MNHKYLKPGLESVIYHCEKKLNFILMSVQKIKLNKSSSVIQRNHFGSQSKGSAKSFRGARVPSIDRLDKLTK